MLRALKLAIAAAGLFSLAGCAFHSHTVERRLSTAPLMEASRDDLIARLAAASARIKTLNATVDITPSVGGAKKGKVTDYTDIRGYILMRKPATLRMIGLFPVVRNRAFDMVSNGQTFKISIPPKNKFVVGRNDVTFPQDQGLQGLRPQYVLDALLLQPVDPADEIAVLENSNEIVVDPKSKKQMDEPNYVLDVVRKGNAKQGWFLSRKIFFNREDLQPSRETLYDPATGNVATNVSYEKYEAYDGIQFPSRISMVRPQEEYAIVLQAVKMKFNEPLTDEQFNLAQPDGSELVRMDLPPEQRGGTPEHPIMPPPKPAAQKPAQPAQSPPPSSDPPKLMRTP